MPHLDIRTAYLIAGLAALLCAATVLVLRNLHRPSMEATRLMGFAMGLGGICMALASLRSSHSSTSFLWFSLLCAGACFALLAEAVRLLYGCKSRMGVNAATIALLGAALAWAPDAKNALVIHFGFQALASAAALWFVLRGRDAVASWGRFGLVVIFSCFTLAASSRFIDAIGTSQLTLLSPDFRFGTTQGPAVLLYALSPLVAMAIFISILSARQVAELTHIATTDELTGLASRRFLFSTAHQWRSDRDAQQDNCALLMIDIDHFKSINDTYGHETGDHVLRHVASVLQKHLRKDSVLARYGGEEFCVLLPVRSSNDSGLAAERLRAAVQAEPCQSGSRTIAVTVSIGVAMHGAQETLQEVLRAADGRLYEAKAAGRNRVVSPEHPTERATRQGHFAENEAVSCV